MLNISNDEHPAKGASQAQVQGQRADPVGRDRGLVNSLESVSSVAARVGRAGGRNDADLCTSIYKETQTRITISNKEKATMGMASGACRR